MSFSSSIPSYLLKVTKFLDKISQFEFLVITKKNIFAYKLFLSLDISDFNLLCDNCTPPLPLKKLTPLILSNHPLKVEVLSNHPFFKFGWRLNALQGWGAHYVTLTETEKLRLESEISLLPTAHPELLNSRLAMYFPCDLNHPLTFDWQTGRQERQPDQKTSMLVVVTHLKHLICNIN